MDWLHSGSYHWEDTEKPLGNLLADYNSRQTEAKGFCIIGAPKQYSSDISKRSNLYEWSHAPYSHRSCQLKTACKSKQLRNQKLTNTWMLSKSQLCNFFLSQPCLNCIARFFRGSAVASSQVFFQAKCSLSYFEIITLPKWDISCLGESVASQCTFNKQDHQIKHTIQLREDCWSTSAWWNFLL